MLSKTPAAVEPNAAHPVSAHPISGVAASVAADVGAPYPDFERRKSRRVACEGTAKVIVLGGALTFTGKIQDLSSNGCRILTEVVFTLERGTQVEVVMVVNTTSFRVAAGVRSNHRARGVGLEFMNVSSRSAYQIQELILEIDAKQKREAAQQSA